MDPHLTPAVKEAVAAAWHYMTDLYDPNSPTSSLYMQARPELAAQAATFAPGTAAARTTAPDPPSIKAAAARV